MNYFYKPKQEVPQKNGTRDLDLRFNLPGDIFQRNLKNDKTTLAKGHHCRSLDCRGDMPASRLTNGTIDRGKNLENNRNRTANTSQIH